MLHLAFCLLGRHKASFEFILKNFKATLILAKDRGYSEVYDTMWFGQLLQNVEMVKSKGQAEK